MSKFEHMSDERALTHAAMVGHLARGTIIEGKSYTEALDGAREAVGEDSENFVRQQAAVPISVGSLDLETGSLYDQSGTPIAGRAAEQARERARIEAEDRAWQDWYDRGMPKE